MTSSPQTIAVSVPINVLLTTIAEATGKLTRRVNISGELDQARLLMESLPLSTEEFSLACNRLWNAGRFVRSGEYGAANWELHTLQTLVLQQGKADAHSKSPDGGIVAGCLIH